MTPVSPHPIRAGWALLAGAALATLAVNLSPGLYYDLVEYRLFDLPAALIPGRDSVPRAVTPMQLIEEIGAALILFLLAKEGWEAFRCERGPFAGIRVTGPLILVLGGIVGAALTWAGLAALAETAEEAQGAPGHAVPMAGDAILAFLVGRMVLGPRSVALQLLLFLTIAGMVIGIFLGGLLSPGGAGLRPGWLLLPLVAAGGGYLALTRPLARPGLSERQRARSLAVWPWLGIAAFAWIGVVLSGLPPALGFLPLLPAMPHARHSFGLFAAAEEFLSDPLNRVAQAALPLLPLLALLFGLAFGGIDLWALGTASWIAVLAVAVGKPLGILLAAQAMRLWHAPVLPTGLEIRDLARVAVLAGIGLTGPVLLLDPALPGGAVREAARAGFGLWLLVVLGAALAWRMATGHRVPPDPPRG